MTKRILILCTGNSCRSQMAAGILKSMDPELTVFSAGTDPAEKVHPKAIAVMEQMGVNIQNQKPKNVSEYVDQSFDYVITVCDHAKETCPVFYGKVIERLHIAFIDPAEVKGTDAEIQQAFRSVRDEIAARFRQFYHSAISPSCCLKNSASPKITF